MEFFTGQCRTVDLSAGSLCPPLIHHNIHHSSAVHQARDSAAALFHWFHSSLFQYSLWTAAGNVLMHQSKIKNGRLTRWDFDIFNSWLASKHISLCNNFLLISIFPAYHAPFIFPISFAFLDIERNPEFEVILNSPHKLDCFSPPCIFSQQQICIHWRWMLFSQWWVHIPIKFQLIL